MAKNRKYQSAAIRFGPVLKVVLLCSLIGGAAVGYVWQKSEINRLGRQQVQREIKLKQLLVDNKRLGDQISILHSPVMLDQRARELQLGLGPTTPQQVVRLQETGAAPEARGPRQFAQRPVPELTP